MNVIEPNKNSLSVFLKVWRPCVAGALRYWLRYPLKSLPAFWNRFKFSLMKVSVNKPFEVPEGMSISSNQEMITHSAMFIEETLRSEQLEAVLRNASGGLVIDVGACYGMLTKWIAEMNPRLQFHCIEPYSPFLVKGEWNTSGLRCRWTYAAASDYDGDRTLYREANALVTFERPTIALESRKVECRRLDSFEHKEVLLLKIDTDGHNAAVLSGATETLKVTSYVLIEKEPGLDIERWFPPSEWSMLPLPNTENDYLFRRRR